MKTQKLLFTTLLFTTLVATTAPARAQRDAYQQAMTDAVGKVKRMTEKTTVAEMLPVVCQFERIAQAEPKEWLPRYYAGLLYVYCGFAGKDAPEKDKFLDQADQHLKAAEALAPNNDELAVLRAYVAQSRMTVDPQNRWMTYGPPFDEAIERARKLNASNPRIYVLTGSSQWYTPEQFGGGPKVACPTLNTAVEKFKAFAPASDLHPSWGRELIEPMLAQCAK